MAPVGNIRAPRGTCSSFYGHSLPTADSGRAVVGYWQKDVHKELVNRLGLSMPRKSVVRLTGCLDMAIVFDWDIKQFLTGILNNKSNKQ